MKQLITKSDGTPTKSKVFAIKFLQDKGIDESCLIQENGQFFYEVVNEEVFAEKISKAEAYSEPHGVEFEHSKPLIKAVKSALLPVTWETPVFNGENRTELFIPNTDVKAVIIAKHPAGQSSTVNKFEISIGQENFSMSLDLVSKLFRVRG